MLFSFLALCDITVFDPNLSYGSDVEVQHELAHCKAKGTFIMLDKSNFL